MVIDNGCFVITSLVVDLVIKKVVPRSSLVTVFVGITVGHALKHPPVEDAGGVLAAVQLDRGAPHSAPVETDSFLLDTSGLSLSPAPLPLVESVAGPREPARAVHAVLRRLMPGVSETGVVAGVVGTRLAVVEVLGRPLGGLLLLPPALNEGKTADHQRYRAAAAPHPNPVVDLCVV